MGTYTYPGVYVREVPSGAQAISGVATSIAAFVGMTKSGPLNEPIGILSFQDYERMFTADTSQGEMSEQVLQFFRNGGKQAYVCRVADRASTSSVVLESSSGNPVLTLTSRNAGLNANQLRARVDYNTASPESSFNLEIYREVFDASGQPTITDSEIFSNLGMNPDGARYAETILNQQSVLIAAAIDEDDIATRTNAATAQKGFSATAAIFADNAEVETALSDAIKATQADGNGVQGRFQLRIEGANSSPNLPISINNTTATIVDLQAAIDDALRAHTSVSVTVSVNANQPMAIESNEPGHDVIITPAAQFDIANSLGLGIMQGGLEVSSHADVRPAPSGLVSKGDLASILALGAADRTTITDINLAGPASINPFSTNVVQTNIILPGNATDTNFAQGATTGSSLKNIRQNLQAIAVAINSNNDTWQTEVHGLRLSLTPLFGSSSSGSSATFSSASPNLSAGLPA